MDGIGPELPLNRSSVNGYYSLVTSYREETKQNFKNLLLTNQTEKPFQPYFGGNLNSFLFSLTEDFDEFEIREDIINAVNNYEPRAIILNVDPRISPDHNSVYVKITFQVVSTATEEELNLTLTRIR